MELLASPEPPEEASLPLYCERAPLRKPPAPERWRLDVLPSLTLTGEMSSLPRPGVQQHRRLRYSRRLTAGPGASLSRRGDFFPGRSI